MKFEDLNAFVAVARLNSFSKAAAQLRISPSSLSKRVQRLEHLFGRDLMLRHARGVTLTAAGAALLEQAADLLERLNNIENDVFNRLQIPSGTVRVAVPPVSCRRLVPLVYEACREKYPLLSLAFETGTSDVVHTRLLGGQIDLGLLYNPEETSELFITPLVVEPLFLIAPARDRATGAVIDYPPSYTLTDIQDFPLLLTRRPHSVRVLIERLCARYGLKVNIACEVDGIAMMCGMIERGHGVAIFGHAAVREEVDKGNLVAIPFRLPLMNWKLCLVTRRQEELSLAALTAHSVIREQVMALLEAGFWHGARPVSGAAGDARR